jgi:hypothetical protein
LNALAEGVPVVLTERSNGKRCKGVFMLDHFGPGEPAFRDKGHAVCVDVLV